MTTTLPNEQAPTGLSDEERRRYSRHFMLPEIGVTGQEKLKAAWHSEKRKRRNTLRGLQILCKKSTIAPLNH